MQIQRIPLTTEPHQKIKNMPLSFAPRSVGKEDGRIYLYGEVRENETSKDWMAVIRCLKTGVETNTSGFTYLGSTDKDGTMYHFYGDFRVTTIYETTIYDEV